MRVSAYHPARDVNVLTVQYVIDALDNYGADSLPVQRSSELEQIEESLKTFRNTIEKSPANILLNNL